MSERHKKLGLQASSSDRWTVCTASPGEIVRRADEIPEEEQKDYAVEGDRAHKLAELTLKAKARSKKARDDVQAQAGAYAELFGEEPPAEMIGYVAEYVELVRSFESESSTTFIEVSAPLPYLPERVCRLDSLVLADKAIDLTDLKYGVGVSVEAKDNTQLLINAVAAIDYLLGLDLCEIPDNLLVRLKIFQPRARSGPKLRQWNLSVAELRAKYEELVGPVARAIVADPHSPEHKFNPDDDTCRFCPLNQPDKGITCRARMGQMFENLPAEIKEAMPFVINLPDPENLDPETIAKLIEVGPVLTKFLKQARERGFSLIQNGTSVPRHKIVDGKNARSWKDEERVKELLGQKLKIDQYAPRDLVSPAQAEKLLKGIETGTRFNNLLKEQIVVTKGEPTLVSEDDPRPALEIQISAAEEFASLGDGQPEAPASGGGFLD